MKKVYVVFRGRRDGSFYSNNEIEENIEKIFLSKQEAQKYVIAESGSNLNEEDVVTFNITEHTTGDHEDDDYDFMRIEEYDLEESTE